MKLSGGFCKTRVEVLIGAPLKFWSKIMSTFTAGPYLGIDYGEKRIGLSFGDELGLAFPLPAANQVSGEERLDFLGGVIAERKIRTLVVGMPYNMNGSIGFKAREVEVFAELLKNRFALPIHLVDERLSTAEARRRLGSRLGTDRESRRSGVLDSAAATLILQDYLDQHVETSWPEAEDFHPEDQA